MRYVLGLKLTKLNLEYILVVFYWIIVIGRIVLVYWCECCNLIGWIWKVIIMIRLNVYCIFMFVWNEKKYLYVFILELRYRNIVEW